MKRLGLCLLLMVSGGQLYANTDNESMIDSAQLHPLRLHAAKERGYVLATGGCSVMCKPGYKYGCDKQITTKHCPPNYKPRVTISVASGGSSCGIERIVLYPQTGNLITNRVGYSLNFISAYIQGSSTCEDTQLALNYTVYCT